MAKIELDNKITYGNIITVIAMVFGLVVWGMRLEGQVERERDARMKFEGEVMRYNELTARRDENRAKDLSDAIRRVENILLTGSPGHTTRLPGVGPSTASPSTTTR